MQKLVLAIFLAFLCSGCNSRIPEPVGYEYSQQQKMQAAQHWNVLADDVASRINNELILSDYLETPVYIKTTCGDEDNPCEPYETSAFNEGFRDLLITDLVNYGVPVRQQPDPDAIIVHYKVQVVYHHATRVRPVQPGLLTGLTAAITVLRNAPSEVLTVALAGMVDLAYNNAVHSGHFEVIITTSMVSQDRYLFRTSDIYYINDKDFYQYQTAMPQTKTIQITAPPADEVISETAQLPQTDDARSEDI